MPEITKLWGFSLLEVSYFRGVVTGGMKGYINPAKFREFRFRDAL